MYILAAARTTPEYMADSLFAYDVASGAWVSTLHAWGLIDTVPPTVIAARSGHVALIWDMHETQVDEVNLTTGAATAFRQLPAGRHGFLYLGIAW